MKRSVRVATLAALAVGIGNSSAWAQQDSSPTNPVQAQTDPTRRPAGDTITNTLVPFGVNPPVPDSATPKATDSVRPPTSTEKIPVPQGNFTSESPNPSGTIPRGTPTGIAK